MEHLHPNAERMARKVIGRSPFAMHVEQILAHARPMIRLDPCKKGGPRRRSWFGGTPCLPPDIQWPVWDPTLPVMQWIERVERRVAAYKPRKPDPTSTLHDTDPRPFWQQSIDDMRSYLKRIPRSLCFLGQIDLADAGDAVDLLELPGRGLLWFFQDVDLYFPLHSESWRVIYRDVGSDDLTECTSPPEIKPFPHTPLSIQPGIELTDESMPEVTDVDTGDRSPDICWLELVRQLTHPDGSCYALGAGPNPDWCRPRACALTTRGAAELTPAEWENIKEASASWRCLLSVESDDGDTPGWQWGGSGAMTYWLSDKAWRRREFNQAWAYMDTI